MSMNFENYNGYRIRMLWTDDYDLFLIKDIAEMLGIEDGALIDVLDNLVPFSIQFKWGDKYKGTESVDNVQPDDLLTNAYGVHVILENVECEKDDRFVQDFLDLIIGPCDQSLMCMEELEDSD